MQQPPAPAPAPGKTVVATYNLVGAGLNPLPPDVAHALVVSVNKTLAPLAGSISNISIGRVTVRHSKAQGSSVALRVCAVNKTLAKLARSSTSIASPAPASCSSGRSQGAAGT